MARIIETPDGKTHSVMEDSEIIDLIREYAGIDAADFIEGRMEDLKYDLVMAEENIDELEKELSALMPDNGDIKEDLYLYIGAVECAKNQIQKEVDDLDRAVEALQKLVDKLE